MKNSYLTIILIVLLAGMTILYFLNDYQHENRIKGKIFMDKESVMILYQHGYYSGAFNYASNDSLNTKIWVIDSLEMSADVEELVIK